MAVRGARVLLLARTENKLREVADSIESAGGHAEIFAVDLADPEALVATTDAIKAAGTVPDVIVNNAGIGRWLFIEETPLEEMRADMALPYFAAFGVTKAFIAEMAGRGSGNICNINGPGAWLPGRARSPIRRRLGVAWILNRASGRSAGHRGIRDRCGDGQDLEQLLGEQPGLRGPDALGRPAHSDVERGTRRRRGRPCGRSRAQTRNGAGDVHGVPPPRQSVPTPRALDGLSGRCSQADVSQPLRAGRFAGALGRRGPRRRYRTYSCCEPACSYRSPSLPPSRPAAGMLKAGVRARMRNRRAFRLRSS